MAAYDLGERRMLERDGDEIAWATYDVTYARNPLGSGHAPWSGNGCVLFVKFVHPRTGSESPSANRLAAIQAAAEILDDNEDLSPSERRLFVLVIRTETTRLHKMIAR